MSDSFAVIVRRDYVDLIKLIAAGVEGKIQSCAAALITYYRHWQEWKQQHQRTDWLYQPLRQLHIDLMELFSIPVIRAANDLLIDLGLLERRCNPGNKQDKTFQYNVRFDRFQQLLAKTIAVSPFEKNEVSAGIFNFSSNAVNTHHNIQFNQVKSSNQELIEKKELESSQKGNSSIPQVEILTASLDPSEIRALIAESWGEVTNAAPPSLDSDEMIKSAESIDHSPTINVAAECLGNLNTKAELDQRARSLKSPRPLCIPGVDESGHEILWKYQVQLEKLNVDLHATRIKSAIADNPQHLEDAIIALIENSATGAKTPSSATGFLLNALRQGWKPRQSSSAAVSSHVYTPHPLMLESPTPATLNELVERKRHLWQAAPKMRPSIKVWAKSTPGVILGMDGPSIAVENATNTCLSEPDATPSNEPTDDSVKSVPTTPGAIATPGADSTELVTTLADEPTMDTPTPIALKVSEPVKSASASPIIPAPPLATDPQICTPTRDVEPPLKVGDRVIWLNAPAHWSNWGALSIRAIEGLLALLDWSELKIPLLELRRVHL